MKIERTMVVITGASRGIGAAVAREMAGCGAGQLVLMARNVDGLKQVADDVARLGSHAEIRPVDLADASAVKHITAEIQQQLGTPDIIINNAGAGRSLFLEETAAEEAIAMMAVPYFAAFNVTRAFLPAMLTRRTGHIVNVTSPAAFLPWPGATGYAASRWAMRGFHEALRMDFRGTGLKSTLVVPGKTRTDYFVHNPGFAERLPGINRMFRTLDSAEVALAIRQAVERGRRQVILPRLLHMTLLLCRFLPWPVEMLVGRTGANRIANSTASNSEDPVTLATEIEDAKSGFAVNDTR